MRVTVTIQAKVNQGGYRALEPFLRENLPNVRSFPGALNVSILFNSQTNDFLIHEEWLSEEHHQAYLQAITENGVLARLAGFFEAQPVIHYYRKEEI
ncbi:putative quinol monooxygenase [Aestuariispira insulae]|uniref:Quinol monooxygenase YgiN n=1 Tax=Aestuariispira insulae TaxID=1461337 RepID=A0A3D9HGC4_9PROT|nr:antibiotic biosynthesis monooxygenase [Aestuariispira insulae]RED48514.1 quinol monooxygenase YgiN [Aestuariispira insulae]